MFILRKPASTLLLTCCFALLLSCGKDYTTELDSITDQAELTSAELADQTELPPPAQVPAATEQPATPAPATTPAPVADKAIAENKIPMMNVPTFGYYKLPENSTPLFSKPCLLTENPSECSSEKLKQWLIDQLKHNDSELKRGSYSVQYVTFEIDKKGKIFNVYLFGSDGNVDCPTCAEIAVQTVKEMPKWVPAMRNGEPVNSSLKLPIRFVAI